MLAADVSLNRTYGTTGISMYGSLCKTINKEDVTVVSSFCVISNTTKDNMFLPYVINTPMIDTELWSLIRNPLIDDLTNKRDVSKYTRIINTQYIQDTALYYNLHHDRDDEHKRIYDAYKSDIKLFDDLIKNKSPYMWDFRHSDMTLLHYAYGFNFDNRIVADNVDSYQFSFKVPHESTGDSKYEIYYQNKLYDGSVIEVDYLDNRSFTIDFTSIFGPDLYSTIAKYTAIKSLNKYHSRSDVEYNNITMYINEFLNKVQPAFTVIKKAPSYKQYPMSFSQGALSNYIKIPAIVNKNNMSLYVNGLLL